MSDQPLPNEDLARTETGELKDQTPPTTETTETPKQPDVATGDKPTLLSDKPDTALAGAPEKYEEFKVPDGFKLDEAVTTEVNGLFKEMNLSQAQAQKLVDFYTAKTLETAQAPYKAYLNMREGWVKEVQADPVIGKNLEAVKTTVSRALDSLGDPKLTTEFKEAMNITGAGDHPAFIRAFYAMAQRLVEGTHVSGTGPTADSQKKPGTGPLSAASAMYPNLP